MTDGEADTGIVHINNHHALSWPECKEALGHNHGGPEPIEGMVIVNQGPESVTLRFDSPNAYLNARKRLFDQSEEMFRYGIGRDAQRVQDFAVALPHPSEVFDDD